MYYWYGQCNRRAESDYYDKSMWKWKSNYAGNIENAIKAHNPNSDFKGHLEKTFGARNVLMLVFPSIFALLAMCSLDGDCTIIGRLLVGVVVWLFVLPFSGACCMGHTKNEYDDINLIGNKFLTRKEIKAVKETPDVHQVVHTVEYWKECFKNI